MLYIIFLTGRCNLNCLYCGGSIPETVMPNEITYSLKDLVKFISKDDRPSIAFYGGEPLLKISLMEEIMEKIRAEHFILQTNGLLLDKLEPKFLRKFSTILVSIDGVKEVNDFYRGKIYERVMENVKKIKKHFRGELIARMVVTERTDIYRDATHLLETFPYVHWQLNVVWTPEDFYQDFFRWIEAYKAGIKRLVDYWIDRMKRGELKGIVPFLGITSSLLGKRHPAPPCGSGENSFAITTDGRVVACPISADLEWNWVGDIWSGIKKKKILRKCECDVFEICKGRCLFFNRERLWSEDKMNAICDATRYTIYELERNLPVIKSLVRAGKIGEKLFYPKFNNSTEIIP